MDKHTIKINTIHEWAEPKKWVKLPLYEVKENTVVVLDCYGNRKEILTKHQDAK